MDPSGWPRYTFGAGLLGCVKYIMLVTQGNVLGCFLGSPGCGYQSVCALSQQVMHHILGIFIERHERAVSAERVGVEPHTAITATSTVAVMECRLVASQGWDFFSLSVLCA